MGQELYAEVNEEGHLVLSPELVSRYGLKRGARVLISEAGEGLYLVRPPNQLAKLYIEPTNLCNLNCRTCIRNSWNEPMGLMSDKVFDRVMEGACSFSPKPNIFFGGLGEPLMHPKIVEMVSRAKELGTSVELITNGTLLTESILEELLSVGLDVLWVSLDGARPESYADVRLGATLPKVIENLARFPHMRSRHSQPFYGPGGRFELYRTQLGIVFVAMKRNIADLSAVYELGRSLGAKRFLVTNVLPYTAELRDQVLYNYKIGEIYEFSQKRTGAMQTFLPPHIHLPRMDIGETTQAAIRSTISRDATTTWADSIFIDAKNRCPFIESGVGAISWDGNLSPCLPLMHSYTCYLNDRERSMRNWAIGNLTERSLAELWNTPEHIAFRERVQKFNFPPCLICGGCELLDANEDDCFQNGFPTCGGCLWAQGVIQCP